MRRFSELLRFLPSLILLFGLFSVTRELAFPLLSALLIHECGHICAAAGCCSLTPATFGARLLPTGRPSYRQELLIAAAGPLFNLLCCGVALVFSIPIFAFFNLAYGVSNLLPIGTLDGGRILSLLFHLTLPPRCAYYLSRAITLLLFALLLFCALWFLLADGFYTGLLPLLLSLLPEVAAFSKESGE